jgi:hypothetical protein
MRELFLIGSHGLPDLVPFFANPNSATNMIAASIHRYGCEMPQVHPNVSNEFYEVATALIRHYVRPLNDADLPDFDHWLQSTSYSEKRKAYFRRVRASATLTERTREVKAFIKYEPYLEPKVPRAILSYSDESKVILGPVVYAIDKSLYRSFANHFVKGSQPHTWPARLRSLFGERPVSTTDFSSFEAHHRGVFSQVVAFWMLYTLSGCQSCSYAKRLIWSLVMGTNDIEFSHIRVRVDQRLMSGAMWTSSSNGLLNLMIMFYLWWKTTCATRQHIEAFSTFNAIVEGDDGICDFFEPSPHLLSSLGVKLKIENFPSQSLAGFCSIYCDAATLECVKDPKKVLTTFFFLPAALLRSKPTQVRGYLRAKALSYKHLFPNAPVVGPLMDWVLCRTRSIAPVFDVAHNHLQRVYAGELLNRYPTAAVTPTARALVAHTFAFPVQLQLAIEKQFRWDVDDICVNLSRLALPTMMENCMLHLHSPGYRQPLTSSLCLPVNKRRARRETTTYTSEYLPAYRSSKSL